MSLDDDRELRYYSDDDDGSDKYDADDDDDYEDDDEDDDDEDESLDSRLGGTSGGGVKPFGSGGLPGSGSNRFGSGTPPTTRFGSGGSPAPGGSSSPGGSGLFSSNRPGGGSTFGNRPGGGSPSSPSSPGGAKPGGGSNDPKSNNPGGGNRPPFGGSSQQAPRPGGVSPFGSPPSRSPVSPGGDKRDTSDHKPVQGDSSNRPSSPFSSSSPFGKRDDDKSSSSSGSSSYSSSPFSGGDKSRTGEFSQTGGRTPDKKDDSFRKTGESKPVPPKSDNKPGDKKDDKPGGGLSGFTSRLPFGGGKKEDSGSKPGDKKDNQPAAGGGLSSITSRLPFGGGKKDDSGSKPGDKKDNQPAAGGGLSSITSRLPFGGGKKDDSGSKPGDKKDNQPASGGGLSGFTSRLPFGGGKKDDSGSRPGDKKSTAPDGGSKPSPFGALTSRLPFGGGKKEESGSKPPEEKKTSPSPFGQASTGNSSPQGGARPAAGGRAAATTAPASGGVWERFSRVFKRGSATPTPAAKPRTSKIPTAKPIGAEEGGLTLDNWLDIAGVGLTFGSLMLFFSALSQEQAAIGIIHKFLGQLFGWGALAVPITMFAIGVWLIVRHFGDEAPVVDPIRVVGIIALFITVLVIMQYIDTFKYNDQIDYRLQLTDPRTFNLLLESRLTRSWNDLQDGGGWVGANLYWLLYTTVSEIGGIFVLIFMAIVSGMLITRLTVSEIAVIIISMWRNTRGRMQQQATARRAQRQLALAQSQSASTRQTEIRVDTPAPEALPAGAGALPALPEPTQAELPMRGIRFNRGGETVDAQPPQTARMDAQPAPGSPAPMPAPTSENGGGLFSRFRGGKPAPVPPPPDPNRKGAVASIAGGILGRLGGGEKTPALPDLPANPLPLDDDMPAAAPAASAEPAPRIGEFLRPTPTAQAAPPDVTAPAVTSPAADKPVEASPASPVRPASPFGSASPFARTAPKPFEASPASERDLFNGDDDDDDYDDDDDEDIAEDAAPAKPAFDPQQARMERLNALRSGNLNPAPASPAPAPATSPAPEVRGTSPASPFTPPVPKPQEVRPAPAASTPDTRTETGSGGVQPAASVPPAFNPAARPEDIFGTTKPGAEAPKPTPVSQLPSVQPDGGTKPYQESLSIPPKPTVTTSSNRPQKHWKLPDYRTLLSSGSDQEVDRAQLLKQAKIIEDTLMSFGAPGRVVEVNTGPVITQFGVEPDYLNVRGGKKQRVKVGAIAALDKDLQLALGARSIRIEAPVPGKGYVGVEVPNAEAALVSLRDVMDAPSFNRHKSPLAIALGQSVSGAPISADLSSMPHLLIAGTTGSGKSVCVNSIITSLVARNTPEIVRFIMVDPKRVELTGYNGLPHLVAPVVVELERIVGVLKWVTREMDDRYRKFSEAGARNIDDYNKHRDTLTVETMPYLVVIIDELADLMMLAPEETERTVTRIAALARATGIHLVIATQRPSVDVVTGLIKANFPARIAFAVASGVDSRVILDQPGAERLLGRGDMLYLSGDAPAPLRLQGVYVSDMESQNIVRYWKMQALEQPEPQKHIAIFAPSASPSEPAHEVKPRGERVRQQAFWDGGERAPASVVRGDYEIDDDEPGGSPNDTDDDMDDIDDDELYERAVELVRRLDKASVSLLQRRLRIGYTRAARMIDVMEARGVVGPAKDGSSKPRDVLPQR